MSIIQHRKMNIKEYLYEKFNENIDIAPTNLGLTNDIFVGYIHGKKVALRIPKEEIEHLSTFDNEEHVLPLIKSLHLDVNEILFDPITRIRITEWVENAKEFKDCTDSNKIIRVARLLKKFHNAQIVTHNEFDCISLLTEYRDNIKHHLFDLSPFYYVIEDIKNISNPHYLCHNDLVSGNILFTNERDYLIDYEYAKDNDPLFDIMSFFTENNITDASSRNSFYHAYFDQPLTVQQIDELTKYERFHNLLWCTWANMMFDLINDPIYLDIAHDKYQALCHCKKEDH